MPIRRITIIGSDTSTQSLRLVPPLPRFDPGVTVKWEITPESGVDSIISIIEKPEGSDNIWSVAPHFKNGSWTGEVKNSIDDCSLYAYSIFWKKGANTYEYDPIIAIRSSRKDKDDRSILGWVLPLIGILAFSSLFFQKKKRSL